jgi:hypothetical protein
VPNTSVVLYESFPGIFRRQFFKVENKKKKKIEKICKQNMEEKSKYLLCFKHSLFSVEF